MMMEPALLKLVALIQRPAALQRRLPAPGFLDWNAAHLIVLDPPAFDDLPRLRKALEPVHVEAFVAQLAV